MYYLFSCNSIPDVGSIPAIKTTEYPDSEYATGTLCQFRFAQSEDKGIMIDIMAFEREPVLTGSGNPFDDSYACVSFDFFPEKKKESIHLVFNAAGDGGLYSDEKVLLEKMPAQTYAGVDEQGWYWGIRVFITAELLKRKYGEEKLIPGQPFKGSAFKIGPGENSHFGSIAPVSDHDPFSSSNFTDFIVRSY